MLQLLRVSLNPFSIDISDSALLSLSLSSPVFFFLLFHVAFCLFVHLFVFFRAALLFSRFVFFFFSVECALHLSLVVRISSRGALQKEKVAIADLHLFLSFFFFLFVCLFALLRWGKSSVTRVDGAESQLYVVSVRFFFFLLLGTFVYLLPSYTYYPEWIAGTRCS